MKEAFLSLPSIFSKALPGWMKISEGILHLSDGFMQIWFWGRDLRMA
jgi:hypothetical protein